MSLLQRFLGGSHSKALSEGMAFLKEGNFAQAVDRLRLAVQDRDDSTSGSLASFHFRQALVGEGRRLLRARQYGQACAPLAEAVDNWGQYPDLRCLHGTALGLADRWPEALAEARAALRTNADYTEARLLEALALTRLDRPREAADSLNSLVESGRRVSHWLIDALAEPGPYTEKNLPDQLEEQLLKAVSGRSEKEEVAEAVALCRGGDWDAGLELFRDLVTRRPRYPDYRTRLAAALFQVGSLEEALAEVEAALALNETYLTAIDLKGLILADMGRILEARRWFEHADEAVSPSRQTSPHEELFGAYLRAVLALLTGEPERVPEVLGDWPDLVRNFARAELLLAAADDLREQPAGCGRRLGLLVEEWVAEPLYFFLLAGHHLRHRRYSDVADLLARWPATDTPDQRPRYLEGCLAVCEGRLPRQPMPAEVPPGSEVADAVPAAAWDFLQARIDFVEGHDQECWQGCRDLVQRGYLSERLLKLQLGVILELGAEAEAEAGWRPAAVLPESCLPGAVYHAAHRGDGQAIRQILTENTQAHPEILVGYWLSPGFWLDPVRGWIG